MPAIGFRVDYGIPPTRALKAYDPSRPEPACFSVDQASSFLATLPFIPKANLPPRRHAHLSELVVFDDLTFQGSLPVSYGELHSDTPLRGIGQPVVVCSATARCFASEKSPIACQSMELRWNPVPAPGGYLVSLARFQQGTEAAPRVILSQEVFTNSYRICSSLEAGSYECSVISLGQSGRRNAPAQPNYFVGGVGKARPAWPRMLAA